MEFTSEHPILVNIGDIAITTKKQAKMVFIESSETTDFYRMEYELVGQKQPNQGTAVTLTTSARGWAKE